MTTWKPMQKSRMTTKQTMFEDISFQCLWTCCCLLLQVCLHLLYFLLLSLSFFCLIWDAFCSARSGKTLSGLLLTDILPWKTVADNLHVCNESALVDLVLIFEPYIGYAQDILKHLIERELVDQHIRLVATILQRKLAIQNALWIPALMRQLLSASIDPDSNLRRYSTKSQEDIVANVIDCFKDFISPGWGTDRLFTVMQSLDNDEKWLQQLCSGKHWRAQDIEQFFGADLAKICQDQ